MNIKDLKKKLFEKSKEHNFLLIRAVPNDPYTNTNYFFEGSDIEEFIDFANKVGVKIIYYDLTYFKKEDSKELVGLSVHFNYKNELYRFNWREDWYNEKLKKDAENEEIETDDQFSNIKKESEKITCLREQFDQLTEQYDRLLKGRFDDIENKQVEMDSHFLELVNALNEIIHKDKQNIDKKI